MNPAPMRIVQHDILDTDHSADPNKTKLILNLPAIKTVKKPVLFPINTAVASPTPYRQSKRYTGTLRINDDKLNINDIIQNQVDPQGI